MDRYRISEAAQRAGFTPSALRFYEEAGLVVPARTEAGYRAYDDRDVDRLRFVARAKRMSLALEDIAGLVRLLDGDRCAPVQERMRLLVDPRVASARDQVADLVAFTADLQRAAAALRGPTASGACDGACGCTSDPPQADRPRPAGVPLAGPASTAASSPVVCTLEADRVGGRMDAWREALAPALGRERVPGGVRVLLPRETDLPALTRLAEAEQRCCAWMTFAITVAARGVALEVTGPPEGERAIAAVLGG
jgi:DNA-binding transcriptional MerR regulator